MRKKLCLLLMAAAMTCSLSLTAFAGYWRQDANGWGYVNDDGRYPYNQWQYIDGKWYYFEREGYMLANAWKQKYYLGPDGAMLTNTTTPDGYRVGADGARLTTIINYH